MANKMREDDEKHRIKSPGLMLNLSEKCKNIFPALFDGLRITVDEGLITVALGDWTSENNGFRANYVGYKVIFAREGGSVLSSYIDSSDRMNSSVYLPLGPNVRVRLDSKINEGSQLATHYVGDTCTASAIFATTGMLPVIRPVSGSMILHYLQSVTPNLDLGAEFLYLLNMNDLQNPAMNEPDSVFSQVSVAGRYTTPHSVWSTKLSVNNVHVGFYNKASEQIEFGVELNTDFRKRESLGAFACQFTLQDRGIVLKGYIDSNTNVGSVFERRFVGTPFALSIAGNWNFKSSNLRLGVGLTIY